MSKKNVYTVSGVKTLHGRDPGEDGYLATVKLNGRKIGTVGMEANGGCEIVDVPSRNSLDRGHEDAKTLREDAHRALGKKDDYPPDSYAMEAEGVIVEFVDGLINAYEQAKWLKRNSKTKTVWKLKGSKEGQYMVWPKHPYSAVTHKRIVLKYGDKLEAIYNQQGEKVVVSVKDKEQGCVKRIVGN